MRQPRTLPSAVLADRCEVCVMAAFCCIGCIGFGGGGVVAYCRGIAMLVSLLFLVPCGLGKVGEVLHMECYHISIEIC